jgi:hypothetical protein
LYGEDWREYACACVYWATPPQVGPVASRALCRLLGEPGFLEPP